MAGEGKTLDQDTATALRDEIRLHVDLYKFFFEWVLKLVIFYYAGTGALVSFYLSKPAPVALRYSLFLPLAVSILLLQLFLAGRKGLIKVQGDILEIEGRIHTNVKLRVGYLIHFLELNAVLFVVVALGLAWLLFKGQ
jgi:hypothetical protein